MDEHPPQSFQLTPNPDPHHHHRVLLYGLGALFLLIIAGGSGYLWEINHLITRPPQGRNLSVIPTPTLSAINKTSVPGPIGDYDVDIRINSTSPCKSDIYLDSCKSDIYLKSKQTGKEMMFLTIDNVFYLHGHPAEYRNGYLFIIRRIGNANGTVQNGQYVPSQNWTDELWRYDSQGNGLKIYSEQGLDFRINNDASLAVVQTGNNGTVEGNTLKVIDLKQNLPVKIYNFDVSKCYISPSLSPSDINADMHNLTVIPIQMNTTWNSNELLSGAVAYQGDPNESACYWEFDAENGTFTYSQTSF